MQGWVKLWRKSIKNGWLRNHKLWVFWTYCLMKASGIDTDEIEKYSQVKLKRGQFIFGVDRASKETKLTYQNIRTCLAKLEKWGNINKQSNNQFSIITILNYNGYNPASTKNNKQTNISLTNNSQTTNKPANHIKEDNKDKKDKKDKKDNIQYIMEVFDYFTLKAKKSLKPTDIRKKIIQRRLEDKYTVEQMKIAIDNFMKDDWAGRKDYIDIVYCLGIRNKIDNLERWLNYVPKKKEVIYT